MPCKRAGWREMVREMDDDRLKGVRKEHLEQPEHTDPQRLGGLGSKLWVDHATYRTMIRTECRKRGI